jgi:hypothetical protein
MALTTSAWSWSIWAGVGGPGIMWVWYGLPLTIWLSPRVVSSAELVPFSPAFSGAIIASWVVSMPLALSALRTAAGPQFQ